jgi:hypothetical protein
LGVDSCQGQGSTNAPSLSPEETKPNTAGTDAMLAKPIDFEHKITLIADSGVQFMDFGLHLALRKEPAGEFIRQDSNQSLGRLVYDERNDQHHWPDRPGIPLKSQLSVPVDESAQLLDGLWLPMPLLRVNPPRRFAPGPETWARARLTELTEDEANDTGHTHRLTLAIDTSVFADADDIKYLAPTQADVASGVAYAFAHRADEIGWFPELPWVAGWIEEAFSERAGPVLRLPPEDLEAEREHLAHHAHYLNLLAIIGAHARIPEIKLLGNSPDEVHQAVPVDMVLDVGNSRTCGILIEQHAKEGDALGRRYELALRDLTQPHRVYSEPFESRVELAQASFGKEHWAHKSGRAGAFLWPTIARIGPEAARLAGRRRGTEGATGISSPKRYLWDEERFETGWRFNSAYVRTEIEPMATAAPLCNLINETGTPLFELPEAERMPVFMPHYTRSSMMMFMLAEVLTQTLCQINSPAQRLRMPNADLPRHLRTLILTIPPSMPKQEREIFAQRMQQALGVVWKGLGWHPEDDPVDGPGAELAWPPFPRVEVRWDEATCCQAVYLFSEIQNTFAGRPEELFRHARGSRRRDDGERLGIATVDIGGGTTDLVINDYRLEGGQGGGNRTIVPRATLSRRLQGGRRRHPAGDHQPEHRARAEAGHGRGRRDRSGRAAVAPDRQRPAGRARGRAAPTACAAGALPGRVVGAARLRMLRPTARQRDGHRHARRTGGREQRRRSYRIGPELGRAGRARCHRRGRWCLQSA